MLRGFFVIPALGKAYPGALKIHRLIDVMLTIEPLI